MTDIAKKASALAEAWKTFEAAEKVVQVFRAKNYESTQVVSSLPHFPTDEPAINLLEAHGEQCRQHFDAEDAFTKAVDALEVAQNEYNEALEGAKK